MTSGVGTYYGRYEEDTNEMVLQDLLNDDRYDVAEILIEVGIVDLPNSVVAELPTTLLDLHTSSLSPMPFGYDPHWDADGNWIP
jgi:hypothetical protein